VFIIKLCNELNANKVNYAICGGYAVALHGVVRGTVDVDLTINLDINHLSKAEQSLKKLGLVSRIPVTAKDIYNFKEEYISKKNLIAWSFVNPKNPAEVVDILINHDLKDLKREQINIQGHKVWILDIPSLIETKKNTGRPQDSIDINALKSKMK